MLVIRDRIIGLVDVNSVSAGALAALPQLDLNMAQDIMDARGSLGPEEAESIAWLY